MAWVYDSRSYLHQHFVLCCCLSFPWLLKTCASAMLTKVLEIIQNTEKSVLNCNNNKCYLFRHGNMKAVFIMCKRLGLCHCIVSDQTQEFLGYKVSKCGKNKVLTQREQLR